MNNTFTFFQSLKSETSPESLSKMQLWGPKHHTKGVDQQKLRCADILAFIKYIHIYIAQKLFRTFHQCAFHQHKSSEKF